jgi:hypothetical protein
VDLLVGWTSDGIFFIYPSTCLARRLHDSTQDDARAFFAGWIAAATRQQTWPFHADFPDDMLFDSGTCLMCPVMDGAFPLPEVERWSSARLQARVARVSHVCIES